MVTVIGLLFCCFLTFAPPSKTIAFKNKDSMEAGVKVRQSNSHRRCVESKQHMMLARVKLELGVQWTRVCSGDHAPAQPWCFPTHSLFQISICLSQIPGLIAVLYFWLNEKFNGSRGADAFISVTQRHSSPTQSPNTKLGWRCGQCPPPFSNAAPPLTE